MPTITAQLTTQAAGISNRWYLSLVRVAQQTTLGESTMKADQKAIENGKALFENATPVPGLQTSPNYDAALITNHILKHGLISTGLEIWTSRGSAYRVIATGHTPFIVRMVDSTTVRGYCCE